MRLRDPDQSLLWKHDGYGRSRSLRAFCVRAAAVRLRNGEHDGEPEAHAAGCFCARSINAIESLKNVLTFVLIHAAAIISHEQPSRFILANKSERDGAADGRVFRAVVDQRLQHLLYFIAICG